MALADYYARGALAAAQVLAGFDEVRFKETLHGVRVGLHIGADAAQSEEGRNALDLLVRLLARTYPTLTVSTGDKVRSASEFALDLAHRINPKIEISSDPTIEIVVGMPDESRVIVPRVFIGSNGWNAQVSTTKPLSVGTSSNPLGPGVAACLGAANLFRMIFLPDTHHVDADATFSVLDGELHEAGNPPCDGTFGNLVLVGAGAIGNAAAWALSRVPMGGTIHIVDHQRIDLSNLQRYVLADRSSEGGIKVEVLAHAFQGTVRAVPHEMDLANFVSTKGYRWDRMLLALDSARDRRAAQASLPKWIANGWTQPGDLGVSTHDFLGGACVNCLYLPAGVIPSEDVLVSTALGIPERLAQVRTLLHIGEGIPGDLLEAVAKSNSIAMDLLQPFVGRPLRTLYTEGFCGGAVLPLGSAGTPRQEVHVPLAHQSALSGILLAASAIRHALGLGRSGTEVIRLNVLGPLSSHPTQPAGKEPRGICICQDADYVAAFKHKYAT